MGTSRDYSAGQVLTAVMADDWAQGYLGSTSVTSAAGPTSATTTLDIATAPAVTIASTGRCLRVTAHWRSLVGTNAGDKFAFRLQEGVTILQEHLENIESVTEAANGGMIVVYVGGPSAASHTFKLTLTRVNGTGTATVQASATAPLLIAVEDVGTV